MQRPRTPRPLRLLALAICAAVVVLTLLPPSSPDSPSFLPMAEAAASREQRTHYQVLELPKDASLKDVKKAYRRLAVKHHPDRNLGNEEEATVKFREISEAYEVLSDEDSRREYDRALKGGFGQQQQGGGGGGGGDFRWSTHGAGGPGGRRRGRREHRDPFAQFNDLFKNDPFFAEAAKSMDDLFDKHFSGDAGGGGGGERNIKDDGGDDGGGGGWFMNKVKDMMPNVHMTTSTTTNFGGSTTHSSTSRSFGNGGGGSRQNGRRRSGGGARSSYSSRSSRGGGGGSTYTSRSTRTIVENGRRVTIQSLEKDGNRIEEKYVGEELIERKINGRKEDIGRIEDRHGREF